MILNNKAFTLVEILAALVLFGIMSVVTSKTPVSSLRMVKTSNQRFVASMLSQKLMAEKEIEYQKDIDQLGVEATFTKDAGKFEKPYEKYSWTLEVRESSLKLTQDDFLKILLNTGIDSQEAEAQLESMKLMLTNLNKALKENYVELFVEVKFVDKRESFTVPIITHLIPNKPKISFTTTVESDEG